ncbi:helix-turn-helix transcriptional regulator [Yersinia bercovieri]|uniref:helix-turn-helix transcriptional regulator n=1 Tax=Yersinia bercovieri TaxID=634 RepID=UPI0011AB5D2B|nr:hypothetical protein [Yersinia bercovieri]
MDVTNNQFEINCTKMRNAFSHCFDWDNVAINYAMVDIKKKKIDGITSDYEWHLLCWEDDLDLRISERLATGVQYWENYSSIFSETLFKFKNKKYKEKVDMCTCHGSVFELISVNSTKALPPKDIMAFLKFKPILSDYTNKLWKKQHPQETALPLREEITLDKIAANNMYEDSLDYHLYMRFGKIRFTRKEISTIRLLLSHRQVKEIATFHGCTVTTERARIHHIKEKLNCQHQSSASLFKALKDHGVTLACLDVLIKTTQ